MDISKNISRFNESDDRGPTGRNGSFDYCFHYFQSLHREKNVQAIAATENIERSCLHLGFYLASWGMLRGSSFLLRKSSKHYQQLIENLVQFEPAIWDIDVDSYHDEAKRSLLIECGKMIARSLGDKNHSPTLKTKIMLGVFGNVPAFDDYFPGGLGLAKNASFCPKNLKEIFKFYNDYKTEIDSYRRKLRTCDFLTGQLTRVFYTRAKIIDMVGFVEGGGLEQETVPPCPLMFFRQQKGRSREV